jgi:hypothetical protein
MHQIDLEHAPFNSQNPQEIPCQYIKKFGHILSWNLLHQNSILMHGVLCYSKREDYSIRTIGIYSDKR